VLTIAAQRAYFADSSEETRVFPSVAECLNSHCRLAFNWSRIAFLSIVGVFISGHTPSPNHCAIVDSAQHSEAIAWQSEQ